MTHFSPAAMPTSRAALGTSSLFSCHSELQLKCISLKWVTLSFHFLYNSERWECVFESLQPNFLINCGASVCAVISVNMTIFPMKATLWGFHHETFILVSHILMMLGSL